MTNRQQPQRVALYLRVSTKDQTTENQRRDLEAVAKGRGWQVVGTFEDNGISGSKGRKDRPGLDNMLNAAKRGEVDLVATWALDRLGRTTQQVLETVAELQAVDCELYMHKQQIDTSTPSGRLFFTVAAAFAEFERDMIRDRITAGLDRARSQGKRLGRRPGWRKKKLKHQDQIETLHNNGLSIRKIAEAVGVSKTTVQRVLKRLQEDQQLTRDR